MKYITLLLSLFIYNHAIAQISYATSTAGKQINWASFNKSMDKYSVNDNVDGSPYMYDEFSVGSILPLEGKYAIRYNLLKDEFHVKITKDSLFIVDRENKDYTINLKQYSYKSFNFGEGYAYFNVLTNNENVNLLRKISKKFVPEKRP